MAESKELVKLIRYEFSSSNLLATLNDFELLLYKIPESIQKYSELCQDELKRIYPKATIEMISHDDSSMDDQKSDTSAIGPEAYVESLIDFEELPDPDEADTVVNVCERIFKEHLDEWTITKDLRPIIQVKIHTKIPITVVRWLCSQKLIEATNKVTDSWLVLRDDIPKIKSLVTFIHNPMELNTSFNRHTSVACYLEEMSNISLFYIPENTKLLVASKKGLGAKLFTPDNTLCQLHRVKDKVELQIEHFIDTTGWSGWKWTYLDWANALKKQADSKGATCEIQLAERNNQQEATGISFSLSLKATKKTTIQILIQEGLGRLSGIIDDANLELNGGPVWDDEADKIYQKDERRFCEDVLDKLLVKMQYKIVRYIHGGDEYGKDFIFEEDTSFLRPRYYGLQAKAGDISGRAKSKIDMILAQIDDAFAIPYKKEPGRPDIYIDTMIIAISGEFKSNAIEKIREKTPKHLVGSLFFWDKRIIRSLISYYWRKEND